MSPGPRPNRPGGNRRLWPWLLGLGLPLAVAAAGITWWHVADARSQSRLQAARAAFAAAGMPTRLTDIVPAAGPEDENAEPLLREARAVMVGSPDAANSELGGVFREIEELRETVPASADGRLAFTPASISRLDGLVSHPDVERFLATLAAATARRTWRPDLDYSAGPGMLAPEVGSLRNSVRLLAMCALSHARSPASASRAWEEIRMIQILGDWADDPPTLIHFLTGVSIQGIAENTILQILETGRLHGSVDEVINKHAAWLRSSQTSFERALHGERLVMLDWFSTHAFDQSSDWVTTLGSLAPSPWWQDRFGSWLGRVNGTLARPRIRNEIAYCYELNLEIARAARESGPASLAHFAAIGNQLEASDAILARVLVPAIGHLARAAQQSQARDRSMLLLLLAVRAHEKSGRSVDNAAELGMPADLALDPCSDAPIVLRVTDTEIMAYAFGPDGDDDGGRELDRSSPGASDGDVVVRLRLPP